MNYILTSTEIKSWDLFTIKNEPIDSLSLMERAASKCTEWLIQKWDRTNSFIIFCGNGNNGGDGLAIARQLLQNNYQVKVYIDRNEKKSIDHTKNLHELEYLFPSCIHSIDDNWSIENNDIIIDALFGIGLQRALEGKEKKWILELNTLSNQKVSIDLPSGLCADIDIRTQIILKADYTLTFQCLKKTFLFEETGKFCGKIEILDIGLDTRFLKEVKLNKICINQDLIAPFYKKRNSFSHKGTYGHTLILAGSRGKMGACILASKSCLRSGTGLLSVLIPENENSIIQMSVPEAMTINYHNQYTITTLDAFQSIAIGCGLGQSELSKNILVQILSLATIPLILDADALNLISNDLDLLQLLPKGSLITPHVKEFDRMFGPSINAMQRFEIQKQKSKELDIIILLKGTYTCICTPGGVSYFNTNGNPGLSTGGTGDVLTGLIAGLFAQHKDILKAALIGVYIHGLAADLCIKESETEESLIASDLINYYGKAFKQTFY